MSGWWSRTYAAAKNHQHMMRQDKGKSDGKADGGSVGCVCGAVAHWSHALVSGRYEDGPAWSCSSAVSWGH